MGQFIDVCKKFISQQSVNIHSKKTNAWNVHCPICKEGNSPWKHRGYFLFNQDDDSCVYYCFNCMSDGMSFYEYMKEYTNDFNGFITETRKAKISNFKEKLQQKEDLSVFSLNVDEVLKETNEESPFGLRTYPITDKVLIDDVYYPICELGDAGTNYLLKRGFSLDDINSYKKSGLVKEIPNIDSLYFPMLSGNDVYGFQTRSMVEKRFYNEAFDNPKIYGLGNIGKSKTRNEPIYIFESIFNNWSTTFPHKLSMLGRSGNVEVIEKLVELGWKPIFCFDNDDPGKEMAIKYSGLGYHVLVHTKDFPVNDFNDALMSGASKEQITGYIEKNVCSPRLANKRLRIG